MYYQFEKKMLSGVKKICANAIDHVVVGFASRLPNAVHVLDIYGTFVNTALELMIRKKNIFRQIFSIL